MLEPQRRARPDGERADGVPRLGPAGRDQQRRDGVRPERAERDLGRVLTAPDRRQRLADVLAQHRPLLDGMNPDPLQPLQPSHRRAVAGDEHAPVVDRPQPAVHARVPGVGHGQPSVAKQRRADGAGRPQHGVGVERLARLQADPVGAGGRGLGAQPDVGPPAA